MSLSFEQQQLLKDRERLTRLHERRVVAEKPLQAINAELATMREEATAMLARGEGKRRQYFSLGQAIGAKKASKTPYLEALKAIDHEISVLNAAIKQRQEELKAVEIENPDEAAAIKLLRRVQKMCKAQAKDKRIKFTAQEQQVLDEIQVILGQCHFTETEQRRLRPIEPQLRDAVNYAMAGK